MKVGDLGFTRAFTRRTGGPDFVMSETYKAGRGESYAVLALGLVKKGETFTARQAVDALIGLGWTPPAELVERMKKWTDTETKGA